VSAQLGQAVPKEKEQTMGAFSVLRRFLAGDPHNPHLDNSDSGGESGSSIKATIHDWKVATSDPPPDIRAYLEKEPCFGDKWNYERVARAWGYDPKTGKPKR